MAERYIGIKGYVGELIVKTWLESIYHKEEYLIKSQIRPGNIDPKRGPYLDFGVVNKSNEVELVCEVKTQDYILDGKYAKINKSLLYLWGYISGEDRTEFKSEQNEPAIFQNASSEKDFVFSKDLQLKLVMLTYPKESINQDNVDKPINLYEEHKNDIVLLSDILERIGTDVIENIGKSCVGEDVVELFKNINNLKNGKELKEKHEWDFKSNIYLK